MIFLLCVKMGTVVAFKNRGEASRHLLAEAGQEVLPKSDPVRQAQPLLCEKGVILLNLSDMFGAIEEHDDMGAQELATRCRDAVDNFYLKVRSSKSIFVADLKQENRN